LAGLFGISLLVTSCLKKDSGCGYSSDTAVAPASEQQVLKNYIDSAAITASYDSRGFYYRVVSLGAGNVPGPCSQITVAYSGRLTSGLVFDTQSNSVFASLGSLIDGWREGIPLIRKGGRIQLYIPPTLGYGAMGDGTIPGNSILIFDISLLDVQ